MNNLLNATKSIFHKLKKNVRLRMILISVLALLLVSGVTFAWYINNLSMWGMTFDTGNIQFNAYVYDANGKRLLGPIASNKENETKYINTLLYEIKNAQVGTTGTVYIAVESTGSIGIDYRLAFDITGRSDSATAYLGGYKYNISKVTEQVNFVRTGNMDVSNCGAPEKIDDEVVAIDRNAVNGSIENQNGYEVYRMDFKLAEKNEEYTSNSINVYFNIFATQLGGDFESTEERGYTYYCSTKEDIDRAVVEAYPGDIIKLSSDIAYYGDLVFNKPVNLETNDFTLTVNGNLMYDYSLANSLKIDVGGLGRVVVQCTKDGVGGNVKIKAPLSNVVLTGANASNGDLVIEKNVTIDATNTVGAAGVNFNNIRIVDANNSRKTIQLESNTRATVSFGTTIGTIQSVVKASNIEIINNGVIGRINLSNMELLEQTNSPQIYVLNNNDISNPIALPEWSVKFVKNSSGVCSGNTTIIQSFSGSPVFVTGSCPFTNDDIEVEKKNILVEQIDEGNDSRLKIYYQDPDGRPTTIQSILEDYFANEVKTDGTINEILHLEIISVGTKAITREDIAYLNSNNLMSLKYLDMERANVYDSNTDTMHKLPDNAFTGVSKYENLILPRNMVEIGANALSNTKIENIITIPSDVTVFGTNWFVNSRYVYFASSVPVAKAAAGMVGVNAVFVDEAYIASFKNVYSNYETRIFPLSVLDESKQHFVRNTKNDEWEITYHIRGEDSVIGENLTIDGKILAITSVYDNAYRHNYTGTTVTFADTVAHLGKANFYGNKNITSVNLKNIKTVGDQAFADCSGVTQVVFGSSLETIGAYAFSRCVSLNQKVILPSTMQKIGAYAFRQTLITEVNTGGTTSIDGFVFTGCASLISVDMPQVKHIAEDGNNELFSGCTSLVSVNMPCLIKVSGQKMFLNCSSLRELYMATADDGISLGINAFIGVNTAQLKLYVAEQHLAFFQQKRPGNINATMIYPKGEKMGEQLVNGYNVGNYVVMDNGNNTYTLVTSNLSHSGKYAVPASYNGKPITDIYANAYRNQSFTDVVLELSNNLISIGANAFYGRSGLHGVKFGNSLETIGLGAFAYCSNWTEEVVLPASMKKIENEAFIYSGIAGINTGGTTSIGSRTFSSCTSLVYVQMPEVTVVAEDGSNEIFTSCTSLVSADMPKLAKVNGSKMFMSCTSLAEIYMGSKDASVTLGINAFYSVDTTKVKLFVPAELVSFYQGRRIINAYQVYPRGEKIGDKAINGFVVGDYVLLGNEDGYTLVTSNLSYSNSVTLPNTHDSKPITEIYSNAFRNQSFTDVNLHLGENMKVIGSGAFYGCSGLKTIDMDNVTTIAEDAFYASGIKVINASKLTTIGNNAFRKCISLEMVSIPRVVRIESTYTFAECTGLKSVYFEDVMYLDTTTLSGCKKLEKITINKIINSNRDNMPATMTIETSAPCKIYVPYGSLSAYTNPWSNKPVVSYDTAATYNNDTYILNEISEGRYALIDFMPGNAITSLTIPGNVTASGGQKISIYAIRYGAFSTVAGTMQSITLSSSIAMLDNNAFSECRALQNIYTNASNRYFTSVRGILYSKDKKMLVKCPAGRSGRLDLSVADYQATVGIGTSAFENAALTEIVFPQSLLVIDGTAFKNCADLKTVTFTGATPPALMGSGIFNTGVEGFKMKIPTDTAELVTAYLCAYNFGEYEPYIDRGGHAAPGNSVERNQVPISSLNAQNAMNILYIPPKDDENEQLAEPPMEDTSGDGPNPPQDSDEMEGTGDGEIKDAVDSELASGDSPLSPDDANSSEQGKVTTGTDGSSVKDSKPEAGKSDDNKVEDKLAKAIKASTKKAVK